MEEICWNYTLLNIEPTLSTEIMNTRLNKQATYQINDLTGLARRCDWFIHNNVMLNITNTSTPKLVFITALYGDLNVSFFITKIMENIKNKFNLIIASEDYTFPLGTEDVRHNFYKNMQSQIFNQLFTYPFLNKIFVENLDLEHDKLVAIPLGLLPQSINKYQDLLNYIPTNIHNRHIDIFNCSRNREHDPQFKDRTIVSKLNLPQIKNYTHEICEDEFKFNLLNSKFTICIHGGGLDLSPRFWQCILCGTIPIIKHSTLDSIYKKFPVVFVNDFNKDTLSTENLTGYLDKLRPYYEDSNNRLKVLELLKMSYWVDIIKL